MRIAADFAECQFLALAQPLGNRSSLLVADNAVPQVRPLFADDSLQALHRLLADVLALLVQVVDKHLHLWRDQVLQHPPCRGQAGLQHQVRLRGIERNLVFVPVLARDGEYIRVHRVDAHQDAEIVVIAVGARDHARGLIQACLLQ